MAKSEFSETQFVFGFLREFFERYKTTHWSPVSYPYFTLPSTVKEKELSADFLIRHYSHSEYYQFKRSDRLRQRLGSRERDSGVPDSFRTYYRFDIYNRRTVDKNGKLRKGQFEKLVEKAALPNDRVYYGAPCFHTESEFLDAFENSEILNRSVLIDCSQFVIPPLASSFNINDGNEHCIVFRNDKDYGYICSEAKMIRTERIFQPLIDVPQPLNFKDYLLGNLVKEFGMPMTREAPVRDEILKSIRVLQEGLLSVYDILWFPMFRYPNG